ncbi:family 16 glycoside hydrolase [Pontibacter sp. G13]|uniref:family 16 glycoside hydrolase n=1 Tax=Pontibacter sp. G13 TaxID=3074898 RepID=UPI00288A9524|nr:family 16 glycoside hydrolase [Pontibacter sp. G13]WNJ17315.1 family 16 glycoside hydrolase [Pontibacter sp. G13]
MNRLKTARFWGILAVAVLAGAWIFTSCQGSKETYSQPARGNDPWVFRSVLDLQPRMVTVALRRNFWVAYDAQSGAIFKAWREGVDLDGPVFTQRHGPQPTTIGPAYFESPYRNPWKVVKDGQQIDFDVRFRGHRFEDDQVILTTELILENGQIVKVEETPEFADYPSGEPGLQRDFLVEGLPDGYGIQMLSHLNSLKTDRSYKIDTDFEVIKQEEVVVPGVQSSALDFMLIFNRNGSHSMRAMFHDRPLVAKEGSEDEAEQIHPGLALIEGSDCKTCHNAEVKTIGPAYIDIAKKYAFNAVTLSRLANKIIKGGMGEWGEQAMTAHPDLGVDDAKAMVAYIMGMDGEEMANPARNGAKSKTYPLGGAAETEDPSQGLVANIYQYEKIMEMPDPGADDLPVISGTAPAIHAVTPEDFLGFGENFYVDIKGYIHIPKTTDYLFRLISDDGAILFIDGEEIVNHDGLHGNTAKDGEIELTEGKHPIRVRYFNAGGGKQISLFWVPHGADAFEVVPPSAFSYDEEDFKEVLPADFKKQVTRNIPGDQSALEAVHPAFDLATVRPDGFEPMVGGMDFMSDGSLIVSTWDPNGSVYRLTNVIDNDDPQAVEVELIAQGLAEPLGLKVVDDQIFVLQKQELTQLIDHNGDQVIDEYRTISNGWRVSANFHEFAFGLVYEDGFFYATLATAINPGGASTQPQIPDRGRVVKIDRKTGDTEFIAQGLRTPNGIGRGVDDELFIADNQGDWLPASKIVHVKEGAFYGSRSVDFEGTAKLPVQQPVVWLQQDEIGNSPSQPAPLKVGPYKGQMVHGEVTHGGLKRVFVEKVDGEYQGVVFRFIQGLEAGVNRTIWGPDGHLYIGGVGNPGNWGQAGKQWYGLQRLAYNGQSAFEMLAIRAKSNGMEIELTEPLPINAGFDKDWYEVKQWFLKPTENYGGPKINERNLNIRDIQISEDRKRIFLKLDGMKEGHIVYVRLKGPFVSEAGHQLWTTEGWYTLNAIPKDTPGMTAGYTPEKAPANTLTAAQQKAGWELLFDGKTTNGWRNFGKETIGSAWRVENGTLTLGGSKDGWQTQDGGDIITDGVYRDYELELEWKISEGGNSGIIYNVIESDEYDYVWQTGPEMQILDNERHPDGRIFKHRAGDLYDLIPCEYVTVLPPGQWNQVKLRVQNGQVEHWLNGRKVVETTFWTPEWDELVAGSKFKDMPGFGTGKEGHIALQDHGDRVWFRNIRIRRLNAGS